MGEKLKAAACPFRWINSHSKLRELFYQECGFG